MYVRGMGAVARNRGYARPGTVVLRIPSVRRGMGQTCTNGGAWNPGLQVCCAPQGTPPMQDPCSILNNPAFIAQQNSQIAQDIATAGPLEQATLAALTSVPVNIGQDAVRCQSNPGATFVDSEGLTINCPSASHTDVTTGGQPMSTYSTAQLAQMLQAQYGAQSPKTAGNVSPIPPNISVAAWAASTANPANKTTIVPPVTPLTYDVGSAAGGPASPGAPGSSSTSSSTSSTGTDLVGQIETTLGGAVTVGGVSLPIWGLAAAALAALWFFGGKR